MPPVIVRIWHFVDKRVAASDVWKETSWSVECNSKCTPDRFSDQMAAPLHSTTACQVQFSIHPCEIGVLFRYLGAVAKGCVELLISLTYVFERLCAFTQPSVLLNAFTARQLLGNLAGHRRSQLKV